MCNNGLCCIQRDTQKRLTKESFVRQKRPNKEAHETYPLSRHVYYDEMATISRLLKIVGLFCKRALWKRPNKEAHETYPLSRHMYYYEVATISRPLRIVGLFCKRALWKKPNKQAHAAYPFSKHIHCYEVATISRPLRIIRLFCRIPSLLRGFFAKETCILRSLLIVTNP